MNKKKVKYTIKETENKLLALVLTSELLGQELDFSVNKE